MFNVRKVRGRLLLPLWLVRLRPVMQLVRSGVWVMGQEVSRAGQSADTHPG